MTADELKYLRELVEAGAGLSREQAKDYLFESRLGAVARLHGQAGVGPLVQQLRSSALGPLHREVVEAMTTQETSFFRDSHPYEALRKVVLPDLIQRRAASRTLNIWCAASSTGQEPYSLAILLREHFKQLLTWDVKILATDLSEAALARARAGIFNRAEIARGLPPALLAKYFTENARQDFQLREDVRRCIEFRSFNLVGSWGRLPEFDLILLRNVLIYFSLETKRRVLLRTRDCLKADGYLLLGSAETTLHVDEAFDMVHVERTSFYRPASPESQPRGPVRK